MLKKTMSSISLKKEMVLSSSMDNNSYTALLTSSHLEATITELKTWPKTPKTFKLWKTNIINNWTTTFS